MYMYEESTHLRWLVVQVVGFMAAYCLLPFMVLVHVSCGLLCCACASACANACASVCAVQVQLQVMCGVCAFTSCKIFHVSIATPGEVFLYATIIVYVFRYLYPWFFLELRITDFFFIFFFTLIWGPAFEDQSGL